MVFLMKCIPWIGMVFLGLAGMVAGAEVDELYQQGMSAYRNGQWNLAVQEFESILRGGYESPVLYFNLGNAYYRAEIVGGAVWAYSKALQLDPTDDDARYNLSLANLRVTDRIDLPEVPFFIRAYRGVRGRFTPGGWVWLVSILLVVIGAVYAANHFLFLPRLGGLVTAGTVVAAVLLGVTVDSILTTRGTREGIVYREVVDVYSAPSERSVKLFEVHEGLKAAILKRSDDWYQIELLDGKSGWIYENQLRPL